MNSKLSVSNRGRIVKEFLKKHWLITLILISVLFMLGIHILYKIPAFCDFFVSEWTAGETLSYGGAIIGAITAIYVLQETIQSTIQIQREEYKLSIRPYFLIKAEEYGGETTDMKVDVVSKNYIDPWSGNINILIRVQNVGAGNAVPVKIRLSQESAGNKAYEVEYLPVIVVEDEKAFLVRSCKQSKLKFELIYSDIENLVEYIAVSDISIVGNGHTVSVYCEKTKIEKTDIS